MDNIEVQLDFGIISGEQKRDLERYLDESLFVRRKDYDEFTCSESVVKLPIGVKGLMRLASSFKVAVLNNCAVLR